MKHPETVRSCSTGLNVNGLCADFLFVSVLTMRAGAKTGSLAVSQLLPCKLKTSAVNESPYMFFSGLLLMRELEEIYLTTWVYGIAVEYLTHFWNNFV